MKKGSTIILRAVILLIGLFVLALCVFALPIGLRSDATGYYQPIIIGLYVAAVPFFIALRQAMKLLDYIDRDTAFSILSVIALNNIKKCALAIAALFSLGSPYIFIVADRDDAPGVLAMALVIIGASLVIATFAAVLRRLFQNALEIKAENDLTV